ncbi:MAG: hypothetical protein JXA21_27375 [Anaerolineae bacterium]|nr:hypothetical protein [Anaerolineae bacterium]
MPARPVTETYTYLRQIAPAICFANAGAPAERFLHALFSLASGRALVPENLVEDFGGQNTISQQVTSAPLLRAAPQS